MDGLVDRSANQGREGARRNATGIARFLLDEEGIRRVELEGRPTVCLPSGNAPTRVSVAGSCVRRRAVCPAGFEVEGAPATSCRLLEVRVTWNGFLADYLEVEAFKTYHALLAVSQQH